MTSPVEEQPSLRGRADGLVRVCVGLGEWCVGLTIFAVAVWIRTYAESCNHRQIFHPSSSSIDHCDSLFASGGVLRTGSAFTELMILLVVVAVPVLVIGPVLLRALRARP